MPVSQSTTPPFTIFLILLIIRTQTQTRMPQNALCTAFSSLKLVINAAMIMIMISEGAVNPKVAVMPPLIPFSLYPINVEVLTAMTPGVHCPTAECECTHLKIG